MPVSASQLFILTFRMLLNMKVDVDAEDDDGWTPLHAAIYWRDMEGAELLVSHGADLNMTTNAVSSPVLLQRGSSVCEGPMPCYLLESDIHTCIHTSGGTAIDPHTHYGDKIEDQHTHTHIREIPSKTLLTQTWLMIWTV